MDASTHVKVIKNGQEGFIYKPIWEEMCKTEKKEGFVEVAKVPVEVIEMKKKINEGQKQTQ